MMRWTPPEPRRLADWRASMIEYLGTLGAKRVMMEAIHAGHSTLLPMVPALDASPGAIGAEILHRSESERLRKARLFYATPDMTALALSASRTTPTEEVTLDRLPAPYGLMVFGEPIGGYTMSTGAALAGTRAHEPAANVSVTTPIVAVSWSPWSPSSVNVPGSRVRWLYKGAGRAGFMPNDFPGIWVTFYSPRGIFAEVDASTVVGRLGDGSPMRAGQIDRTRRTQGPVLAWDNEMVMRVGGKFEAPRPDTNGEWAATVYTAWQLMTQKGGEWTQTETVPRSRSGVKRDGHGGITSGSDVEIVDVHPGRRPSRAQADQDAAQSTGLHRPHFSCRWPVEPYRRNTCLNTHAHADGGCRHEDRIVPGHIKGPEGAPLRTRERVALWSHQPNQ